MASKVEEQLEPWARLDGKIVMVTGASSGIGWELCLDLAKAGCRIIATARRADRLDSLCNQINTTYGDRRAIAVVLDIMADGLTIEPCVDKAWAAFGHIDVLINNAGIRGIKAPSLDFPEEEFNRIMKTNLRGSWLVSKFIGVRMRNGGRGGSIINISTLGGYNRTQNHGSVAYGSSKAGLDSITRIMALELGDYNIKVNGILPGIVRTEITEKLFQASWAKRVDEKILPLTAMNGAIDPVMTSLVRYLIHDSSAYITGNIFIADAGLSLPGVPLYSSL